MRDTFRMKAAALAALLLAGCNNAAPQAEAIERSNVSIAEATALVGERFPLHEGLWEASGGVTALEIPDLPGDPPRTRDLLQMIRARAQARGQLAGRACLRQQDAQNALANLPGLDATRCRVERFRLAGDRGTMVLACAGASDGQGRSRVEIASTYAADSRTIETNGTVAMRVEPGTAMREARIRAATTMRRVGDCPPGQAPAR